MKVPPSRLFWCRPAAKPRRSPGDDERTSESRCHDHGDVEGDHSRLLSRTRQPATMTSTILSYGMRVELNIPNAALGHPEELVIYTARDDTRSKITTTTCALDDNLAAPGSIMWQRRIPQVLAFHPSDLRTGRVVRKHKVAAGAKRRQYVAAGAGIDDDCAPSAPCRYRRGSREYRARFLGIYSRTAGH